MASAVEAVAIGSNTGANNVSAGPITPAGANRFVLGFGANSAGGLADYTDMTFGGGAMTPKANHTNPNYERAFAEELVAPATSSQSLVCTLAASQDELAAAVIALSGVDQSTPTGTYATGGDDNGDPMSIAITVGAAELGIAWFYAIAGTIAAGDTPQAEVEGIGGSNSACLSSKAGVASAMTATRGSIGINDWVGIAVPVKAAAGGGGGSPGPQLMLMGVGS